MRSTSRRRRIQLLCCALIVLTASTLASGPSVPDEGAGAASMEPEEKSNDFEKPSMSGEFALLQFLPEPILI